MNFDFFQLEMPWRTQDPFLFCVYHRDNYPRANQAYGPSSSLNGRNLGNDFVVKDGFRMYHGKEIPGFPAHPHRGFETFTVVREGIVDHADSLGGNGRYGDGDAQWMTAGAGVQHAEMFPLLNREKPNPLELFQIWINLPSSLKMCQPDYKMIWAEDLVIQSEPGVKIINYMGDPQGKLIEKIPKSSWGSVDGNFLRVAIIEIEPHSKYQLPSVIEGVNRSLYCYEGEDLAIDGEEFPFYHGVELENHQSVTLSTTTEGSKLLLLQSVPIGEAVVQYGPFVMNTKEELQTALDDFRKTEFGGWPWNREDAIHGQKARYAQYIDGTTEVPKDAGRFQVDS